LSIGHLSTWYFVNLLLSQLEILTFINLPFFNLTFVQLTFCQLVPLLKFHFVKMQLHQLAMKPLITAMSIRHFSNCISIYQYSNKRKFFFICQTHQPNERLYSSRGKMEFCDLGQVSKHFFSDDKNFGGKLKIDDSLCLAELAMLLFRTMRVMGTTTKTRRQCCKHFYGRNLRIFVIS
jgi:hypothetical protein